jgi:acyl carrier protein
MPIGAQEIEKKIFDIVANKLSVERGNIKRESHFVNDLGADSLDTVELVMEIEEAFSISIPEEDAQKMQTVGDAVEYIEKRVNDSR